MTGFVDLFLDNTKTEESPTSFFRWAAYAGIAALLRDNTFIDRGSRKIYPNVYVLLLANSADSRKSVPLDLIANLVTDVQNTKIIRGRTSIQAVIDTMADTQNPVGGKRITGGSILLCADELASFIVNDPSAVPLLTDLYDPRPDWRDNLRGTGTTKVKLNCVTMLAASNETHLKEVYTTLAVYGGLLGRTFFVRPNEFRKADLMTNEPKPYQKQALLDSCLKISRLTGPANLTIGALAEFNKWYEPLRESYKQKVDKTGVIGRVHTGVLKIALCLAAGQTYSLDIQQEHIEQAIDECMALMPNYSSYAVGTGKASIAEAGAILLNDLWAANGKCLNRKDFLFKHWTEVDAEILERLETTLESAGMIQRQISNANTTYIMTKRCSEIYQKEKGK